MPHGKELPGGGEESVVCIGFQKDEVRMSSNAHDCCRCAGRMRQGRHDFMARVVDEIIVIKEVPALICDTCHEVEYTLEVSREIDVIMKDFFAGRLLAKPLAAGEIRFMPKHADSTAWGSLALTNKHASR